MAPKNFNEIIFQVPAIFEIEQNSTVRVFLSGSAPATAVDSTNARSFQFVAFWTSAYTIDRSFYRGDGSHTLAANLTGPATGGTNLTIRGHGFRPQVDYLCVFSRVEDPQEQSFFEYQPVVQVQSKARMINVEELQCATPVWNSYSGVVSISLNRIYGLHFSSSPQNRSHVQFVYTAAVQSLSDYYYPSGNQSVRNDYHPKGNPVSVLGRGFSRYVQYFCNVMRNDSNGDAMVIEALFQTHALLECRNMQWGTLYLPGAVKFFLKDTLSALPIAYDVPRIPLEFNFVPALQRIRPTTSSVAGGVRVTITGIGFEVGKEYLCKFVDSVTGTAAESDSVIATSSSDSLNLTSVLVFSVPRWEHGECIISIDVRDANGIHSIFVGPGSLEFLYTSYWLAANVTSASASGGDVLQISGQGFDNVSSRSEYACVFHPYRTPLLNVSTSAGTFRHTSLICRTPLWPFPEGKASLILTRNGAIVILNASVTPTITFTARLTSVHPTVASGYGGEKIVVKALGFDKDTSDVYECVWSSSGSASDGAQRVNGTVFDPSTLECDTPIWVHQALSLDSFDSTKLQSQLVSFQIFRAGNLIPTVTGQAIEFDFHYTTWQNVSTTEGRASGGDILTITGTNFKNISFECRFTSTSGHQLAFEANSTGFFVSDSIVKCATPFWNFTAQSVVLRLMEADGQEIKFYSSNFSHRIFTFHEEVTLFEPSQAPSSGDTRVTISGFGFTEAVAYACVWTSKRGSSFTAIAEMVNKNTLLCTISDWGLTRSFGNASLIVTAESESLAYSPGVSNLFNFYSIWTGITPTLGGAEGGTSISIFGFGFKNDSSYDCSFSSSEYEALSTALVLNISTLQCHSPQWPEHQGQVILNLYQDSMLVTSTAANKQSFLFYHTWITANVSTSRAAGGEAVAISADGLDPEINYKCIFTAIDSPSFIREKSATVVSNTRLLCSTPFWDTAAQNSILTIHGQSQVYGNESCHENHIQASICTVYFRGSTWQILFTSAWTLVSPSVASSAGGMELTVAGYGFDASKPTGYYQCFWDTQSSLDISSSAQLGMFTNATAETSTNIKCNAMAWGIGQEADLVKFYLVTNDGHTVQQEQLSSNTFSFFQAFQSLHPISGSAEGGTRITIRGFGFHDKPDNYSGSFQQDNGDGTNTTCTSIEYVNSTTLVCTSPAWPYAGSKTNLTLEFVSVSGNRIKIADGVGYSFIQSWSQMNVTSGPASGGTVIAITGAGFHSLHVYSCIFTSSVGQHVLSVGARFMGHTELICQSPFWDQTAQSSIVSILDDNKLVDFNSDDPTGDIFVISAAWTLVSPSVASSAGGMELTVTGLGFNISKPSGYYKCVWAWQSNVRFPEKVSESQGLRFFQPFFSQGHGRMSSNAVQVRPGEAGSGKTAERPSAAQRDAARLLNTNIWSGATVGTHGRGLLTSSASSG